MDEQNTMGAGLETTDYGDDSSIEMNDGFDWGEGDTSPDAAGEAEAGGDAPLAGEDAGETTPEPEPDGDEPAGKAEDGLKITYNGQEMTLSAEEARTLAQKGMNYDKVHGQLQAAQRDAQAAEVLREVAESSGMSPEQYVTYLRDEVRQRELAGLVEGGMTPEAAGQFLELKHRDNQRAMQDRRAAEEAARVNSFVPLTEKYPDVKALPPEVWQLIGRGNEPLAAYETYLAQQRVAELETQLKVKQTDDNNRRTVPGSARGIGGGEAPDTFLSGFGG